MSDNVTPIRPKPAPPRKLTAIDEFGKVLGERFAAAAKAAAKHEEEISELRAESERLKRRIERLEAGFDVRHAIKPVKDARS
jgi:cell division protein FtsB